jgi:endonuclease/exonuclease/phosphatase (EEP) superfamily protein YafD
LRAVLTGAGLAIAVAACAPTVNLLNPDMPRFEGQYALGAGALTSATDTLPAGTPLRVVSFNVKLADQIDSTIQLLRASPLRGADVIALQEMDEAGTERIARALHLNYIYYPGSIHPTRHRYFGPALLTPWPIVATRKLILPHEGLVRHQRRNGTAATILVRGRPVRAYAVHLETQIRASDHDREDQVDVILRDAADFAGPVIVAGDFNSWGIGEYFERKGYSWPTRDVGHTISVFAWDHIFARGLELSGGDYAGQVRQVRGASDHHPVWAVLTPPEHTSLSSREP